MKMCAYNLTKRCYHSTCSIIDRYDNVSVCRLHPNPFGFLMRRRVKVSPVLGGAS